MESLNLFLDADKSKELYILEQASNMDSPVRVMILFQMTPLKPKNAYAASKAAFSKIAWV